MLAILLMAAKPDPIFDKIIRKWQLVGIQTSSLHISEAELKAKNNIVIMEFVENGYCLIKTTQATSVQKNKWDLHKDDKEIYILMESDNGFGEQVKQKMKIEEISKKKLVLSVGVDKDRELYTYKALR